MQDHATKSKKWVRDAFAAVNIHTFIPDARGDF
jgi:hypothetical protein